MKKDFSTASVSKTDKRRFASVILIICLALNLINCFGIQLFYYYEVSGNVSYVSFQALIENVIRFLDIAVLFTGYAVICRTVMEFGMCRSLKYYFAVAATMMIPYISNIVITKLTTAESSINYGLLVIYSLLNYALDIIMLAIVGLIALLVRSAALKKGIDPIVDPVGIFSIKNPLLVLSFTVSAVYTAVVTVQTVINTVDLVATYGAPINFGEVLTLATPYLENVVFFIVRYCIMIALMYCFRRAERKA